MHGNWGRTKTGDTIVVVFAGIWQYSQRVKDIRNMAGLGSLSLHFLCYLYTLYLYFQSILTILALILETC